MVWWVWGLIGSTNVGRCTLVSTPWPGAHTLAACVCSLRCSLPPPSLSRGQIAAHLRMGLLCRFASYASQPRRFL